ncbi:UPF0690 protein C1orf52 homolog isoform X2 [Lethenteron reissneri]|uniref:UPF0690 protein C1orf52 homolog isoform X2 n=1 Tax=Lethenteron reissneri TaxID=7753 RepID=UPI002AB730B0|nr:UPF0690 protein C1orf52 homolog isoform X2 [Lethenteron reissneri]XP_061404170.1 UPF0690 protein C1orf52 homolog isoform X2 [Lethenteron reissneri]
MAGELPDPLSFFVLAASSNDSDGSSSDEEEEEGGRGGGAGGGGGGGAKRLCTEQRGGGGDGGRLPSPAVLLSRVLEPSFLQNPYRGHIDWERRAVKGPEEPPREFKPWLSTAARAPAAAAASPAAASVKRAAPTGPDLAVRWSQMYRDDEEEKAKEAASCTRTDGYDGVVVKGDADGDHVEASTAASTLSHQTPAPPPPGFLASSSSSLSSSRPAESFQERERKKRERGQANRDASFVEEEKRILRHTHTQ